MANRGAYGFNGTFYNTREEAEAAREQAKAAQEAENRQRYAQYIDAYSVGFDKNKYDALIASGQGVSSISDNEANYIRSKFTPSYSTKYKNSATDQYLASVGLPPSADLSKYRDAYTKYTSSGSAQDVYGFLSNDDWNKINELWSKDWQYGLTNEDFIRQQYGYAPVSYDSMYEDTLLDDQLKAAHLPPSKLLNGKLGEAYTTYVNNGNKYNEFMTDAINRKIEEDYRLAEQSKIPVIPSVTGEVEERPTSYSLEQAINDMRTSEKWSAWAAEHFGSRMELPDQFDEAYKMKDSTGYVTLKDVNGQDMYDLEAYNKDFEKARKNNAALDADDFAITYDKAQQFYDANYEFVKAVYDGEKDLYQKGIYNPTEEQINEAADNRYKANSILSSGGFTVGSLFPDATAEETVYLTKWVDKVNQILREQGYNAAADYISSGSLSKDMRNDGYVSYQRGLYAGIEGNKYESMSDEEVLNDYYKGVQTQYGLSDSQLNDYKDGNLKLSDYMSNAVHTDSDAWEFARQRLTRELAAKGLPTTKEELEEAEIVPSGLLSAESILSGLVSKLTFGLFDKIHPDKLLEKISPELAHSKAVAVNVNAAAESYDDMLKQYYIEALQYTDDFKERTSDMSRVNAKFDDLVHGVFTQDTATDGVKRIDNKQTQAVLDNATDDEKKMAVYLADVNGWSEVSSAGQVEHHEMADQFIKALATSLSNEDVNKFRADVSAVYNEQNALGRFAMSVGAVNLATIGQPIEGVYNFIKQSIDAWSGRDLYANESFTWASDVFASVASEITKEHGDTLGSIYQMIPSFQQSAAGAAAAVFTGGASEAFTLAVMGTQTYSSTTHEALLAGRSTDEAYSLGIVAGAAEIFFEKVSLDKFVKDINVVTEAYNAAMKTGGSIDKSIVFSLFWNGMKHQGSQGVTESSEEVFTNLANTMAEQFILKMDSDYNKARLAYMDAGLSESDANTKSVAEIYDSIKMDAIMGFASGALMTFGSDIINVGSTVSLDKFNTNRFMSTVHDLSAISFDDAMDYVNQNATIGEDGISLADAQKLFPELLNKGADYATLSRVRNEVTSEEHTGDDVNNYIDSVLSAAKERDTSALLNATRAILSKRGVSRQQIDADTEKYITNLSKTVQESSRQNLQKEIEKMQRGYIAETLRKTGKASALGAANVLNYIDQNTEAVNKNAEKYINVFEDGSARLSKSDAAFYANMASAIELMVSDQDFQASLKSTFGNRLGNVAETVQNIFTNTNGSTAKTFVDAVSDSIGVYDLSGSNDSLTHVLSSGLDTNSYIIAQLAVGAHAADGSTSNAIYNQIASYGSSQSLLDLLSAQNRYNGMTAKQRNAADAKARLSNNAVSPTSDVASAQESSQSSLENVREKEAAVESRKARNAEAEAESASNVARYEAEYDAFYSDTRIDRNGNVVRSIPSDFVEAAERTNAAREQAIAALNKLREENAGRLLDTENDAKKARSAYKKASETARGLLDVYSSAYVRMFGSQLEAMRNGQRVSKAEMDRLNALARYGTDEDLNSVRAKIDAAEKRVAVAVGHALGATVEVCDFTEDLAKELKQDIRKTDRGFKYNGKIYLNGAFFNGDVGYGAGEVFKHEFGHIIELASDKDFAKYKRFAFDYLRQINGNDIIDKLCNDVINADRAIGRNTTRSEAENEILAEFSRTYMMTDSKAISTLCKKAPVMSTRILQWITNVKSALGESVGQGKQLDKAQIAYAKALKSVDVARDHALNADAVSKAKAAVNESKAVAEATEKAKAQEQQAQPQTVNKVNTPGTVNGKEVMVAQELSQESQESVDEDYVPEAPPEDASVAYGEEADNVQAQEESAETPQQDFSDIPSGDEKAEAEVSSVRLPFSATPQTREKIMNTILGIVTNNADAEGRLPKAKNELIIKIVTFQLTHDANYVDTDLDVIRQYAEQFTRPQIESEEPVAQTDTQPAQTDTQEQTQAQTSTQTQESAPREVKFNFDITNATETIKTYAEYARNNPSMVSNEDILNAVKRQLEKAAKEQNKRKPKIADIREFAKQFYHEEHAVAQTARSTNLTQNYDNSANEDAYYVPINGSRALFQHEFNLDTLVQNYSVKELNDKYMPLARKIVDGTATGVEHNLAALYKEAVAKIKGADVKENGRVEDSYHGTDSYHGFGFTEFFEGDKDVQKHLTFTATNPRVANSYTRNEYAQGQSREIRTAGNLYADMIEMSFADSQDTLNRNNLMDAYQELANELGKDAKELIAHDLGIIVGGGNLVENSEDSLSPRFYLEKFMTLQSANQETKSIGNDLMSIPLLPEGEEDVNSGLNVLLKAAGVMDALGDISLSEISDMVDFLGDYLTYISSDITGGLETFDATTAKSAVRNLSDRLGFDFDGDLDGQIPLLKSLVDQYSAILYMRDALKNATLDQRIADILGISNERFEEIKSGILIATDPTMINAFFDAISEIMETDSTRHGYHLNDGYVMDDDEIARAILDYKDSGVYHLYTKSGNNQYVHDADGGNWGYIPNTILYNAKAKNFGKRQDLDTKGLGLETNSTAEYARRKGYSSTRLNRIHDAASATKGANELTDLKILYDQLGMKSADVVTLDDKGNIIPLTERYNWDKKDLRYNHEIKLVEREIENMSKDNLARFGNPTLYKTADGAYVSRDVSLKGMQYGYVGAEGERKLAMIAPVNLFTDGQNTFIHRDLKLEDCAAVVIPNAPEYAQARQQARDTDVYVETYDDGATYGFESAKQMAVEDTRSVQYFPGNGRTLEDLINKYGAHPVGEEGRQDRRIPKQTSDTNRVSKSMNTLLQSPITTDKTAKLMMNALQSDDFGTYEPVSNARTLSKANSTISKYGSLKQAAATLHSNVATDSGKATENLAIAEVLYAQMQNDDTLTDREREGIISDLILVARDAGRALQLMSAVNKMTPEGHIGYMEQAGKRIASKYEKRTKMLTDLSLTEEEKARYRMAKTEEEIAAIDEDVTKRWGEQTSDLPLRDRMRNWRYFSMLANPRTHLRNITGNALMVPIVRAKDAINAAYQHLDTKIGNVGDSDRHLTQQDYTTTGFTKPISSDVRSLVEADLEAYLPIMQGVSSKYIEAAHKAVKSGGTEESAWQKFKKRLTADVATSHLTNGKTAFGRAANAASSVSSNALEIEDAAFLGLRFKSSMYQQIQAKGIDVSKMTDAQHKQMINYAMEEALKSTFRDASAVADAISQFTRNAPVVGQLVEGILPFKKTPINIAKRGMEYSPIGLVQGLYKQLSNNSQYKKQLAAIDNMNISDSKKAALRQKAHTSYITDRVAAIDRLASGTTGSLLMAIGALAASLGWISVRRKDDAGETFEGTLGKARYSLNVGDTSIDLSAFSPAAIPLIMGASVYELMHDQTDVDGTSFTSALIGSLAEVIDPISEMTVLSSFADALGTKSYGNEDAQTTRTMMSAVGSAVGSYIGQHVPTAIGQLERTFDPYQRSYSAGDDYWASKAFGSGVGTFAKNMQNKVGLGWLSEPKIDVHGNEQTNYTNFGSFLVNWANQQILPATWKADQKNDVDREIIRLYGVVDSSDIFPQKPNRSVGSYKDENGKNVTLKISNDQEYMEYQKDHGQAIYNALEVLMSSPAYDSMSDEEKAKAVSQTISDVHADIRKLWKAKLQSRAQK